MMGVANFLCKNLVS